MGRTSEGSWQSSRELYILRQRRARDKEQAMQRRQLKKLVERLNALRQQSYRDHC